MSKEMVELDDITFVHETEVAILIRTASSQEIWLSKSQCSWDQDAKVLNIRRWLAEEYRLV